MPLPLLFQDEFIVAVNKPAGLLVHPSDLDKGDGQSAMTLLRDQLKTWVYPVHRLDKATSGVLLFAKSPPLARQLSAQFEARIVEKHYIALVRGWPGVQETFADESFAEGSEELSLTEVFSGWSSVDATVRLRHLDASSMDWKLIDRPLGKPRALWSRKEKKRYKRSSLPPDQSLQQDQEESGTTVHQGEIQQPEKKSAQTKIRTRTVLEIRYAVDRYSTARYSVLEISPLTGRPHQIRRHLKAESHPIIGDRRYGKSVHNNFFASGLGGFNLALKACALTIDHPVSGERLQIRSDPDGLFSYFFPTKSL